MEPRKKLLVWVASIGLVIIIALGVINFLSHHGKVKVEVLVAPTDSSLTIDGLKTKPGTMWLTKTTHEFKATRQYFGDAKKTLDLRTYDITLPIYLTPEANTPEADEYLKTHGEQQQAVESAGGIKETRLQDQITKIPFLTELPFIAPGFEFQIDYDAEGDQNDVAHVTIYVGADTEQAKQDALSWITSRGVDPAKLHIVYVANDATGIGPNAGVR